jgi:fluoride exporter
MCPQNKQSIYYPECRNISCLHEVYQYISQVAGRLRVHSSSSSVHQVPCSLSKGGAIGLSAYATYSRHLGYGISLGISRPEPPFFQGGADNAYHKSENKWWAHEKMKGIEFALLAAGAVAGAFVRFKFAESPLILGTLPVNILIINVIGSFILGIFSILSIIWNLDTRYSLLVAIGFCGSLTTMSSFALETNSLIENRQFGNVAINIIANVALSIGAVMAGRSVTDLIVRSNVS